MQLDGIRYHLKRHCDSLYSEPVRTSIIIMDVGTITRIVAGPDEGSIGGKARHQQPDPSLFWPPAHPTYVAGSICAQDHVDDSGRGI